MPFTVTLDKGVAELVWDFPPVNAFKGVEWLELADVVRGLARNGEVDCLVLAAEGRGLHCGVDVKELQADADVIYTANRGCRESFGAIYDFPVPTIAACHGFVLGGGIGISGSCDIVIASDDATFGMPEIDRGAMGAATHLRRLFPEQVARRMFFTGEPITAEQAYRLGALEAVVPRDALRAEARALAEKIAGKSPLALRLAKESFNGIELMEPKRSYRYEQGFTLELYGSPDSQEARDAFVDKRDAKFED
jgi:enoyl-CoA hydratase